MKKIITVILALALLAALVLPAVADAYTLYVNKDGVKVYAKKDTSSKVYKKLSKGTKVLIETKSGKWYSILVQDPSGDGQTLGWIQAKYLSTTKPSKKKQKKNTPAPKPTASPQKEIDRVLSSMRSVEPYEAEVVTKTEQGTVALRWQPTKAGKLIRQVMNGSRVKVLAEGDGWFQVTDDVSGSTGFMSSAYLSPVEEVANDEDEEAVELEDEEPVEDEDNGAEAEPETVAEAVPADGRVIAPIDVALDIHHLPDGEYPAAFDPGDVAKLASGTYMNGVHIYSLDRYEADDIESLAVGDRIVVDGQEIAVNAVGTEYGYVTINGGLDGDNGFNFRKDDDGTYVVNGYDDLATYTDLGTTSLMLDTSAVYKDGADPDAEPVSTSYDDIVSAIQSAEFDSFNSDNTRLTIKDGKVVVIERIYTP